MNKFMESKYYGLIVSEVIVGSFVMYWVNVSGSYLLNAKIAMLLIPFVIYCGKAMYTNFIVSRQKAARRKQIMLNALIRRAFDRYVA